MARMERQPGEPPRGGTLGVGGDGGFLGGGVVARLGGLAPGGGAPARAGFWAVLAASTFLVCGMLAVLLVTLLAALIRQSRAMEEAELLDPLTGLLNHRHFLGEAQREMTRAIRYRHTSSVLLLDVDDFKRINDTFGRRAGDMALGRLAAVLRQSVRDHDMVGRLGGEEFAVLLPETTAAHSEPLAERLRVEIEGLKLSAEGRAFSLTVSIGVSEFCAEDETLDPVLRRADAALYEAKLGGRNRVVVGASATA